MLEFKKSNNKISIDEVEPLEDILKRFSGSMSHGALSAEAHETLAMGMNKLKVPLVAEKEVKMQKGLKFYPMVIVRIQE